MKKTFKKAFSLIIALVMCMGLAVTAFAAEGDYVITVDPANSGETYTAYKVLDATYATTAEGEKTVAYTIDKDSPWFPQVSEAEGVFILTEIPGQSGVYTVEEASSKLTGADVVEVLSYIPKGAEVAASVTAKENKNETTGVTEQTTVTLDVSDSGGGYYYVTTSLGSVVSINTAVPEVTVRDKNEVPSVTKEVLNESHSNTFEEGGTSEGTTDTAKIGDIIEFKLTIKDASSKSAITLHDYMDAGFTYNGVDSTHVYLNSIDSDNEINNSNYTLTYFDSDTEHDDNCDIEIEFAPSYLAGMNDNDVIIVTYEATVNENATNVDLNNAYLTYGDAGQSATVTTQTTIFGITLETLDSVGENVLEGATYTLQYKVGGYIYFIYDSSTNTYTVTTNGTSGATTDIYAGRAVIFGLDEGDYILTETASPDGYLAQTETFVISIDSKGVVTAEGSNIDIVHDITDDSYIIGVINYTGATLPSTGATGTIIAIIGCAIVAGGVITIVTYRKRTANKA